MPVPDTTTDVPLELINFSVLINEGVDPFGEGLTVASTRPSVGKLWPRGTGGGGATGPAGPPGVVSYYEQTSDPGAVPVGSIWVDTDDAPPTLQGVPRVTSLPSSPTDGQEICYVADATNNVIWNLRYNAGSSSAYKWEFVGGGWLSTVNSATQSPGTLGGSFAYGTGQLILPLAGEYAAMMSLLATFAGNPITFGLGDTGTVFRRMGSIATPPAGFSRTGSGVNPKLQPATAGTNLAPFVASDGGSTGCSYNACYIGVQPLRVG